MHLEYPIEAAGVNLARTVARAETLARRVAKRGMVGGWTVTTETRMGTDRDGQPVAYTWLIIDGEAPAFSGYRFVGVAEWLNGQPIVTGSPWYTGPEVVGADLRENECDHCGVRTYRKRVIIVEDEQGERKQVGSACVKDFLGHELSPSWWSTRNPFDEFDGYEGFGERWWYMTQIAAITILSIRAYGWHRADDENPTKLKVSILADGQGRAFSRLSEALMAELGWDGSWPELVRSVAADATQAIAWGQALTGDSGWVQNARAVALSESIPSRMFGLAASVVAGWLREQQRAVEAAAEEADPVTEARYAPDKTKVEFEQAKLVRVQEIEGAYGVTSIYEFIADGHRFTWFASNPIGGYTEDGHLWAAGEDGTYRLRGTVKGESEYRGKVSTLITRCKVVREGQPWTEHGHRR